MSSILLVEDSATDEKLALMALKKCGVPHEVAVARDGAEAVDYLYGSGAHGGRDLSLLPTVVLLDLKLPKLDGLEVLRQIRANARTRVLPVVVMTASNEEEDILRSLTLGANAYVRKPVDFTQFTEAIQTMAKFWLLLNERPPALRHSP